MVEHLELLARVAKCFLRMKQLPMMVFNGLIQDYLNASDDQFDVVLLLNVFDQMLRANEEGAWEALKQIRLRSDYVFMMVGPCEQLPNTPGVRTGCPSNIPFGSVMQSDESGYDMILRKGEFKEHRVLLRNSFGERELWLFR